MIPNPNSTYIYLHGFASGPESAKGIYFKERFQELGIQLHCLDLNQPSFRDFSLTRNIQTVRKFIHRHQGPVTLIGSSFGGLTAAWVAQAEIEVGKIILLAPAFDFYQVYFAQLTDILQAWESQGFIEVDHYTYGSKQALNYGFVTDLKTYIQSELNRPVATLIFHGDGDEIIPASVSIAYAEKRPWVEVKILRDDHSLQENLEKIWQEVLDFCPPGPGLMD